MDGEEGEVRHAIQGAAHALQTLVTCRGAAWVGGWKGGGEAMASSVERWWRLKPHRAAEDKAESRAAIPRKWWLCGDPSWAEKSA